jgi:hypothetical protein
MPRLPKDRTRFRTHRLLPSLRLGKGWVKNLWVLLLAGTVMLSACGGGSSSGGGSQIPLSLSGNWQFTVAPPADGSYLGGVQGGFLVQTSESVTGSAAYSVWLPQQFPYPCNSGSAQITGTITGQNVTLTAAAGTQTFIFTGTLSLDSSTMAGSYASTAGTNGGGTTCGTAQTGLQWSAALVPPITGPIQGTFYSTGGAAGLEEQEFLLSGALNQAANAGTSSASVTGSLSFLNPTTNLSDYPCLSLATVNGEISGNTVVLQIIGADGSVLGQIGDPAGSNGVTGVNPATVTLAQGGYALSGAGPTYMVATSTCPGGLIGIGDTPPPGDYGNLCLALGSATACQQPITLTPSGLVFPAQVLGSPSTTQTITLTNASGAALGGLTLALANNSGANSFTETDACGVNGVPSLGQPFDLQPGLSCAVMVSFAPQAASHLAATLTVSSPSNDMILTAPITGSGVSANAASTLAIEDTFEDAEHHAETH